MVALHEQPHKPQAVRTSKSLGYILKPKGLPGKSQAPLKAEGWEPASNHEHKGESLSYLTDRWTPSVSHILELPFQLEIRSKQSHRHWAGRSEDYCCRNASTDTHLLS